jgi:hypothetical protein
VTAHFTAPLETIELHRQVRAVFATLVRLLYKQAAVTTGNDYKPQQWAAEFRHRLRATKSFFLTVELQENRFGYREWRKKSRKRMFNWDL